MHSSMAMCDPSLKVGSLCCEVAIYLFLIHFLSLERNHYANIEHIHEMKKKTIFLITVENKIASIAEWSENIAYCACCIRIFSLGNVKR